MESFGGSYRSNPIHMRPAGRMTVKIVLIFSVCVLSQFEFSGGFSEGEIPVPIPNTAVKPFSADGTARVTSWESRSPPGIFLLGPRFFRRSAGPCFL